MTMRMGSEMACPANADKVVVLDEKNTNRFIKYQIKNTYILFINKSLILPQKLNFYPIWCSLPRLYYNINTILIRISDRFSNACSPEKGLNLFQLFLFRFYSAMVFLMWYELYAFNKRSYVQMQ